MSLKDAQTGDSIGWSGSACIRVTVDPSVSTFLDAITAALAPYEHLACGVPCFEAASIASSGPEPPDRTLAFSPRGAGNADNATVVYFSTAAVGDHGLLPIIGAEIYLPQTIEPIEEYLRLCIAGVLGLDVSGSNPVDQDVFDSLCHLYGTGPACSK